MKAAFAFVFLTVLVTLSMGQQQSHGNGQPQCNDQIEFTRRWRNNWDPTAYFECVTQGAPANQVRCGANTLFIERDQECGAIDAWEWNVPFDPPNHN